MQKKAGIVCAGFRLYQWLILGALAAAVIGAYGILIHLVVSRLHPPPPRREIVLAAPAEGAVVTAGGSLTIQAKCRGADVHRVELWVDSMPIHTAARSLPADDSPWNVTAEWTAGWPGIHHISARGLTPAGEMVSTAEQTVLVV
ncbi:MAG: Ig-like domain-containing protein, partial [Anaerolineae bacterium]